MTVRKLPALTTRTIEVKGIVLPWEEVERYGSDLTYADGRQMYPERKPTGTVVASGEVFISLDTLYELSEQDVWDSQFGSAYLLGHHEGLALEKAGLAVRETRGGYHRSETLLKFLESVDG